MLFNSLDYLIFFPIVATLYLMLPFQHRWLFLLLASCYFYIAFVPVYILVLFALITVDYFVAIGMENSTGKRRKCLFTISILATCLILFIFKYFNFFNVNFTALAEALHWNYSIKNLSFILPIGLSFHTFQSLSYVFEIYRGNQKAERHFGIYALYVMFFPQLVAGPIERPQNLLPQFYKQHQYNYERITDGLKLICWGLFKKVVIADRVALCVNMVYNNPASYSGPPLILATIFFAFQIYCDFSGYSDIAIGSARVMGFKLMQNFNNPYGAASIREFWKRWHISLTTWFRDYLYFPLGGNRVGKQRFYFNIMVVFIISGLWHGANWTFLIWGMLNGFYLLFSVWTKDLRAKVAEKIGLLGHPGIYYAFKVFITFSLICFSWIFFRSNSIHDAFYIVRHIFDFSHIPELMQAMRMKMGTLQFLGLSKLQIFLSGILICFLLLADVFQKRYGIFEAISYLSFPKRWALYYLLVLAVIFLGHWAQSPFIYFQF